MARLLPFGKPRIFVQIASYRDPECQWTIQDIFQKAKYPERVFIGLCSQVIMEEDAHCFTESCPRPKQLREIRVPASESLGVCWARSKAQSLYRGEEYVLMTDSHMRFVEHWDEKMLTMWESCHDKHALLSSYPPGYTPPDNLVPNPKLTVQRLKPATKDGDIRGDGKVLEFFPERPMRGAFIAGGFIFAPGKLVRDVPYDPYLYFNQEEISLAARFFTHGWNVYHPNDVLLYHYYKVANPDSNDHKLHWRDNRDWGSINRRASQRLHHLVGYARSMDPDVLKDIEKYGLGKKRSLAEFEKFSGAIISKLQVTERAVNADFIDYPPAKKQATSTPPEPQPVLRPPLEVGQFLPPFALPDSEATHREIQLFAGKRALVCLLPYDFPDYIEEFLTAWQKKYGRFSELSCPVIFVCRSTVEEAAKLRARANTPHLFLADSSGELWQRFGWTEHGKKTPLTILLNANQKILGLLSERNAQNHLGDMLRIVEQQPAMHNEFLITRVHAPVIIIPEAITQSLAEEILTAWKTGAQYQGTIGMGSETKVVNSGKRRIDVNLTDRELLKKIDHHLAASILPELKKVAAFDALYRERYKIGCYDEKDAGFYNQHRDTGIPSLAHRRYSMSLALNDGYEGGTITFPEYGPVHYRLEARAALLFPSTLLHAVTPVTKGQRYVMVSFMHGEAEEQYRKEQMLQRGENYNVDEVRMFLDRPRDALPLSEFFYTRSA